MATDDNSGGTGSGTGDKPRKETDEKTNEQGPINFVDRDDDLSRGHVDFDYEDSFPADDAVEESETPDPGYAAFAEDLDDPLADWPSPDAKLEDLPEVQLGKAAAETPAPQQNNDSLPPVSADRDSFGTEAEADVVADSDGPSDMDERSLEEPALEPVSLTQDDEFPEAEFFDDPAEDETPAAENAAAFPAGAALAGEISEEPEFGNDHTFGAPEPESVDRDEEHPQADAVIRHDELHDKAAPEPQSFEPAPEPEPMPPLDFEEDEDALVDDFLNDLDDGEEFEDEADLEPALAGTDYADRSGFEEGAAPTPDEPQPTAALTATPAPTEESQSRRREPATEERSLPWGMIVVVVIALALLAAGGYGVIMQRSSLEAEIRELQAQLATAMPPEEAAAERERQRQIELQNEALTAELEGLQAENSALGQQIASLEAQVEERRAAETQARERAEAAAREAEAAAQRAAAAKPATPAPQPAAKPTGAWFVNFGSYAQRNVAERWAAKLTVEEGKVVVQQATAAGKSLYRVRVINLPSQDRAERVATVLERQHQLPRLWVGKD